MRRSCYPSDTSDAEWLLVEAMLPVPACKTAKGGRPEAHPRRAIWDAIRYVNDSGCKWRALPKDFPPFLWNPTCPVPSEISLVDMCSPVGSKAGSLMCCEHGDLWF